MVNKINSKKSCKCRCKNTIVIFLIATRGTGPARDDKRIVTGFFLQVDAIHSSHLCTGTRTQEPRPCGMWVSEYNDHIWKHKLMTTKMTRDTHHHLSDYCNRVCLNCQQTSPVGSGLSGWTDEYSEKSLDH